MSGHDENAVPLRLILAAVAAYAGMRPRDLIGRDQANASAARHAFVWCARCLTVESFPSLGRFLGGRDHTTMMNSVEVVEKRRAADQDYAAELDVLKATIAKLWNDGRAERFLDADATAIAERIERDPVNAPIAASVTEIAAMARRLLALEEIAGATVQLFARIDDARALAGGPHAGTHRAGTLALVESLVSQLAAAGYDTSEQQPSTTGEAVNDHAA
jgi:chromosomal replication initiator protein